MPGSGKKKYTFHRPAPAPTVPGKTLGTRSRNIASPATGRKTYTFHNPAEALGDDGQTGWHVEAAGPDGITWTCDYGCKSFPSRKPPGRFDFHTPDCAYWQNEGREGRPLLRANSRRPIGEPWHCRYGCKPFIWGGPDFPGQYHGWNCDYWNNEGSLETPFDNRRDGA